MLQAGIVDPAKVVRAALQNAASVAGLLVTTEAIDHGSSQEGERSADAGRGRHGWNGRHGLLWTTGRPFPRLVAPAMCRGLSVQPRSAWWGFALERERRIPRPLVNSSPP